MKYRFRPSKRRLPEHAQGPRIRRLVLKGRNTLKTRRRQEESIRFFSLFELAALPSPPVQKKERRLYRALCRLWSALRVHLIETFKKIRSLYLAARQRRLSKKKEKTVPILPILSGALCAVLLVSALSATTVLLGLLAPYSRAHVSITVPHLVGRTLDDVLAGSTDETVNLIVQYESNPDVPAGTVIHQIPRAGVVRRIYEKNGYCNVTLTVSRPSTPYVLEDLVGVDRRDAILSLHNQSLTVTVREIESTAIPIGCVVRTEPSAGSELVAGECVTILVSRGKQSTKFSIPNLVGMSETDASARLQAAGFSLNQIHYRTSSKPSGSVLSQSPSADTQVASGTKIDLTVSIGPSTDVNAVPDLFGLSLTEATARLAQNGMSPFKIYTVESPAKQGTVLRQTPSAGIVASGADRQIILYVSS